jgi:phage nucleotide-binding protein
MSKIKKANELSTTGLMKILVYGQPGIGKSTLALSMPAPLMIDCDRGIHRVNPEHLSDTVEVDSWSDIDEVLNEDLASYKTVIFDTGGKLIDFMTTYIIKNNPKLNAGQGQLSLQGYGVRKAQFQALLRRLHVLKKHVVFVAHEREEKDGDTRIVRPEIGGSSGNDLIKELDLVGYMEASGNKRVIHFNPQDKFYAKNGLRLDSQIPIPDASKGNTFMQSIVQINNTNLETRAALIDVYNSLIALIHDTVDECETADSLNETVEWALGLEYIWDSKLQASNMIHTKAGEMGLKFDREAKKYTAKDAHAKKEPVKVKKDDPQPEAKEAVTTKETQS